MLYDNINIKRVKYADLKAKVNNKCHIQYFFIIASTNCEIEHVGENLRLNELYRFKIEQKTRGNHNTAEVNEPGTRDPCSLGEVGVRMELEYNKPGDLLCQTFVECVEVVGFMSYQACVQKKISPKIRSMPLSLFGLIISNYIL